MEPINFHKFWPVLSFKYYFVSLHHFKMKPINFCSIFFILSNNYFIITLKSLYQFFFKIKIVFIKQSKNLLHSFYFVLLVYFFVQFSKHMIKNYKNIYNKKVYINTNLTILNILHLLYMSQKYYSNFSFLK